MPCLTSNGSPIHSPLVALVETPERFFACDGSMSLGIDPEKLLTPAERALRDARLAADSFDYGNQYCVPVEAVPVSKNLEKSTGDENKRAHFFNRTTGATGWAQGDVLAPPPTLLVVQLSTEEGGRERGIVESDLVTEVLHLEVFDRNYPYNRRKVRRDMMATVGDALVVTETGQREGGQARGAKCIRFRGDVREIVRDYLVREGMAVDWPWTCVNADGFAVRDEKRPNGPHHPGGLSTTQGPRLRAAGADSLDSLLQQSGGRSRGCGKSRGGDTAASLASGRPATRVATSEMPLAERAAAAAAMPVATCVLTEHPAVGRWLQTRVDADGSRRVRAMLKACAEGRSSEVRRLLNVSAAEKDCCLADGVTPLMTVARHRYRDPKTRLELWQPLGNEFLDVANELLRKRADPNVQTADGYTALFHAVSNNQQVLSVALHALQRTHVLCFPCSHLSIQSRTLLPYSVESLVLLGSVSCSPA